MGGIGACSEPSKMLDEDSYGGTIIRGWPSFSGNRLMNLFPEEAK
jgi:hypothetical protein